MHIEVDSDPFTECTLKAIQTSGEDPIPVNPQTPSIPCPKAYIHDPLAPENDRTPPQKETDTQEPKECCPQAPDLEQHSGETTESCSICVWKNVHVKIGKQIAYVKWRNTEEIQKGKVNESRKGNKW